MARNPRACRARSSASKPVASAQAPWTNTIVGVSAAIVATAPLLTICPMPRLHPGGRAQPRQANLRWGGYHRVAERLAAGARAPSPGGCRCAEGGTPYPCPRDHPARPGAKLERPQAAYQTSDPRTPAPVAEDERPGLGG